MPSNSDHVEKVAILLLGYNRPEFIRRRMQELGEFKPHKLIISIDGGCGPDALKEFKEIQAQVLRSSQNMEFILHGENLGLVRHITGAITKTLESHEYVIVVEDDVCLAENYVENILKSITLNLGFRVATFGGFSPVPGLKNARRLNSWRRTKYFSAWGWCVGRDIWSLYSHEIDEQELIDGLKNSKKWNSLSEYQKATWIYRFEKIIANPLLTWDYQMQFLSFKMDFEHVLPIFRISDNEGFSDTRSTNTKATRPRWMGTGTSVSNSPIRRLSLKTISWLMERLDSLTIAGDSRVKEIFGIIKRASQ
ncbi:hypothetical protein MCERE3_00028 [Candidatus Nanopelagicaceae bacterium]